jgi:hypothetical protein
VARRHHDRDRLRCPLDGECAMDLRDHSKRDLARRLDLGDRQGCRGTPGRFDGLPLVVAQATLDPRLPGFGRGRRPRFVLLLGLGHGGQPERGVQADERYRVRRVSFRCSCCSSSSC